VLCPYKRALILRAGCCDVARELRPSAGQGKRQLTMKSDILMCFVDRGERAWKTSAGNTIWPEKVGRWRAREIHNSTPKMPRNAA